MRLAALWRYAGLIFLLAPAVWLLPGGRALAALPAYRITITDGVYKPESLEVPAGQRFKLVIKNTGKGPAEFENLSLRVEKVLAADVESFVVIHPLKPGKYHFIDEFHLDMAGFTIIVTEPKN